MKDVVTQLIESIKKVPKSVSEDKEADHIRNILFYGECGALIDQSSNGDVVGFIHELFKNDNSKIR
jgi:hypothetical protein